MTPKYKRILLKLSGEALMGEDPFGINRQTIETIVAASIFSTVCLSSLTNGCPRRVISLNKFLGEI
ncbi:MAG TPA: hypothetical protein VHG88_12610, partial [Burkholderiales bacterium]|nr:hypothetical protein [Burkholderiales bacterium]